MEKDQISIFVDDRYHSDEKASVSFLCERDTTKNLQDADFHNVTVLVCPENQYGMALEVDFTTVSTEEMKLMQSKQFSNSMLKEVTKSDMVSIFRQYMDIYDAVAYSEGKEQEQAMDTMVKIEKKLASKLLSVKNDVIQNLQKKQEKGNVKVNLKSKVKQEELSVER